MNGYRPLSRLREALKSIKTKLIEIADETPRPFFVDQRLPEKHRHFFRDDTMKGGHGRRFRGELPTYPSKVTHEPD